VIASMPRKSLALVLCCFLFCFALLLAQAFVDINRKSYRQKKELVFQCKHSTMQEKCMPTFVRHKLRSPISCGAFGEMIQTHSNQKGLAPRHPIESSRFCRSQSASHHARECLCPALFDQSDGDGFQCNLRDL